MKCDYNITKLKFKHARTYLSKTDSKNAVFAQHFSVGVAFRVNLQSKLYHHTLLTPPTSSLNNLALVFSKIKSTLKKTKTKTNA